MARRTGRRVLDFNFGKLIELVEILGDNAEPAVEEAIKNAANLVQPKLDAFFEEHKETGKADESLIQNPKIVNERGKISMRLGFDKSKPHGEIAYYFEHGTPKSNPSEYKFIQKAFKSNAVRNAIRDTLKSYMTDAQKEALKSNRKSK